MLDTYKFKLDFSNIEDFWDIHRILKESLEFPDYYGGNLDALFDCLTDMLGDISIIEMHGLEELKKYDGYDQRLLKVFSDTKHAFDDAFSDRFFVTVIHKDGTEEKIK